MNFFLDMNLKVVIQPRGLLRIIQLVISILAVATTASFETVATFVAICREFEKDTQYKIGYPFKLGKNELRVPEGCNNIYDVKFKSYTLPFDFSLNAILFVAVGILALLVTGGIIFLYVFMHRLYSTKPMASILDLVASGVLSILWLAASYAWTQCVSDIKYHSKPEFLFNYLDICEDPKVCHTISPGNFDILNVSWTLGFLNSLLMIPSLWFSYKETSLYQKKKVDAFKKDPLKMELGENGTETKNGSVAEKGDETKNGSAAEKGDETKNGNVAEKRDETKNGSVAEKGDETKNGSVAEKGDETENGNATTI